jgi:hypothetical protein
MADPPKRPRSLDEAAGLVEPGKGPPLSDSAIGPVQRGERFTDPKVEGEIPSAVTDPLDFDPYYFRLPRNGSHVIPISRTPSEPGFDEALGMGLAYEIQDDVTSGNFHRDPNGNPTRWGVDQTMHPSIDVANLSRAGAVDFYKNHPTMWPMAKNVPASHGELRAVYFEGLINSGSHATKAMQIAFGMTGREVDGSFGSKTHRAMEIAIRRQSEESLIRAYFTGREGRYRAISAYDPQKHGKNLRGWLNRVKDTADWYDVVIKSRRSRV